LKDLSLFIEKEQIFLNKNRQVLPEFRRKLPVSFGKNKTITKLFFDRIHMIQQDRIQKD